MTPKHFLTQGNCYRLLCVGVVAALIPLRMNRAPENFVHSAPDDSQVSTSTLTPLPTLTPEIPTPTPTETPTSIPTSIATASPLPTSPSPSADECPEDPNKTTKGVCGCGVADSDEDGDGVVDCLVGDSPLACGETPSISLESAVAFDNKDLAGIATTAATKLEKLVKQFQKKYGAKSTASLSRFITSSKRATAKAQAATDTLVLSLPTVLVSCPGTNTSIEISNVAEKTTMISNTNTLNKLSLRIVARLAFYQVIKNPNRKESSATKAEQKRIKAAQKATNLKIASVYSRLLQLIAKVPDLTQA